MTSPKARKAAQGRPRPQQEAPAPEPTAEDPLADLREPDDMTPREDEPEQEPEQGEVRPMVSQETHDAMLAEVIVAWHADPTALGFLHKAGRCGCRYLARVALRSVVPVMTPEDEAEQDLEPSGAE